MCMPSLRPGDNHVSEGWSREEKRGWCQRRAIVQCVNVYVLYKNESHIRPGVLQCYSTAVNRSEGWQDCKFTRCTLASIGRGES